MKLNDIIEVESTLLISENKSYLISVLTKIGKMSWEMAKAKLRSETKEFIKNVLSDPTIDERSILQIINKNFGVRYPNLKSILNASISEDVSRMDEGLKDWWKEATGNMYGALSFYPLLTAFLEMDKVLKGSDSADYKSMIVYFMVWILVISGKVVAGAIGKKGEAKP